MRISDLSSDVCSSDLTRRRWRFVGFFIPFHGVPAPPVKRRATHFAECRTRRRFREDPTQGGDPDRGVYGFSWGAPGGAWPGGETELSVHDVRQRPDRKRVEEGKRVYVSVEICR